MSAAPARAPKRPHLPRSRPGTRPSGTTWPVLRLVPPPGPRRTRLRQVAAVAFAGVVVVGLLGLAGLHAVLAADQVKLDKLEAEVASERDLFAAHRLEVADLEAPQHVRRAAEELGLVSPPPGGTVYLVPSEATIRAVDGLPPLEGRLPPPAPPLKADPAPGAPADAPPVVATVPGAPGIVPPAPVTPADPAAPAVPADPAAPAAPPAAPPAPTTTAPTTTTAPPAPPSTPTTPAPPAP